MCAQNRLDEDCVLSDDIVYTTGKTLDFSHVDILLSNLILKRIGFDDLKDSFKFIHEIVCQILLFFGIPLV